MRDLNINFYAPKGALWGFMSKLEFKRTIKDFKEMSAEETIMFFDKLENLIKAAKTQYTYVDVRIYEGSVKIPQEIIKDILHFNVIHVSFNQTKVVINLDNYSTKERKFREKSSRYDNDFDVSQVLNELKDIIIQMQIDIIAKKAVCLDIMKHFFVINK